MMLVAHTQRRIGCERHVFDAGMGCDSVDFIVRVIESVSVGNLVVDLVEKRHVVDILAIIHIDIQTMVGSEECGEINACEQIVPFALCATFFLFVFPILILENTVGLSIVFVWR